MRKKSEFILFIMPFILVIAMLSGCRGAEEKSVLSGPAISPSGSAPPGASPGSYPSVTDDKVPASVITARDGGGEIPAEQRTYCWGKLGCADYIWGMQGMEETLPHLSAPANKSRLSTRIGSSPDK